MKKIRTLREAKGWTQGMLAGKLGVTESTVCNYEKGKREPDIETLKKLAAALGCTIDELVKS